MKIIVVHDFSRPHLGGNLNVKQLFNPIFFERSIKHPDRKRQRCTKQHDLDIWRARQLRAK